MTEKEEKSFSLVRKIILLVAAIVSVLAVCFSVLSYFNLWEKFQDLATIQAWIEAAGPYAIIVYGVLVLLQVVILPIPSTLTNFVASLIGFEPWVNFLVTSLCTIAGSYICFWLGRFFGKKLVTWLVGAEKTEKYAKILNDKGRFLFVMMLVLPCFPDDVLCMVAGLSTMGIGFLSLATILARPVMIAVVSFGSPMVMDALDTWGLPVSIGIVLLILIAVLLVTFRRDRKTKKSSPLAKSSQKELPDDDVGKKN